MGWKSRTMGGAGRGGGALNACGAGPAAGTVFVAVAFEAGAAGLVPKEAGTPLPPLPSLAEALGMGSRGSGGGAIPVMTSGGRLVSPL